LIAGKKPDRKPAPIEKSSDLLEKTGPLKSHFCFDHVYATYRLLESC